MDNNMPNYALAHGDSNLPYQWQVTPVGIRGWRGIRKILPFLSGDELRLKLVVESKDHNSSEYEFSWILIRQLPNMKEQKLEQEMKIITVSKGKTTYPLKTFLFQYGGEYRFFTQMNIKGQDKPHPQTLINFKVLAVDDFYTTILVGLISGIIGVIIGVIGALMVARANGG